MNFRTRFQMQCMAMISVLILCITPAVFGRSGQMGGPPAGDFIEHFDTDGDGQVSEEEFTGPQSHFAHLDKNADGYISEDEKPSGPPRGRRSGNPVKDFDKDGDGKVSREEFPGPADHFDRFDADNDGFLSESEMPKGPPPGQGRRSGGSNGQTS